MITQSELKEHLHYNPETGKFTWLKPTNRRILAGSITGNKDTNGYSRIQLNGRECSAHRLAFLYMEGEMPSEVDHKNHKRDDNRWLNLRPITHRANCRHLKLDKRNKSGCNGVTWDKRVKKWYARISNNDGKVLNLGLHNSVDVAITIRKAAEGWVWNASR